MAAIDLGIKQIDTDDSNPEIAGLVEQLRDIQVQYKDDPQEIPKAREEFLDKLSFDERQAVLSMERMPQDKIPIINGIVSSFFRDKGTGGQIFRTEKEKITPEYQQFKYDTEKIFGEYYDNPKEPASIRENYRKRFPETDAILFLYGKVTAFKTDEAFAIAEEYYGKYGKFDYEMKDPSEQKKTTTPAA